MKALVGALFINEKPWLGILWSLVTGHSEISLNPFDIATTQLTSSAANCQYPEVAAGGAPHRDGDVLGG